MRSPTQPFVTGDATRGRLPAMALAPSTGDSFAPLFDGLTRMRSAWPTRGWSWDSRLSCVTSSFSVQFEAQARAAASEALPVEWTATSILKAPAELRDLSERYGGMRSGQLLLAREPGERLRAFGLWWPWGNGQTISLRVGLDIDAARDPFPRFRELFGATT
jgi:hypothetical protein